MSNTKIVDVMPDVVDFAPAIANRNFSWVMAVACVSVGAISALFTFLQVYNKLGGPKFFSEAL